MHPKRKQSCARAPCGAPRTKPGGMEHEEMGHHRRQLAECLRVLQAHAAKHEKKHAHDRPRLPAADGKGRRQAAPKCSLVSRAYGSAAACSKNGRSRRAHLLRVARACVEKTNTNKHVPSSLACLMLAFTRQERISPRSGGAWLGRHCCHLASPRCRDTIKAHHPRPQNPSSKPWQARPCCM